MKQKSPTKESAGHSAHTQDAIGNPGLPGKIDRPIKVTVVGAGSGFTPKLLNDILRIPGNKGGTLALVDIDAERLSVMVKVMNNLISLIGAQNWKVIASTDRKKVMAKTDYLINCIEVDGLKCVRIENDIPEKYGIDQCIGDTIGPGGLFKALRTVPVYLDLLKDAEKLCPKAWVLNYTNPMNAMCLAAQKASFMETVGLCHSVQGTSKLLAKRAGVPFEEIDFDCAGINHLAWFTRFEHKGRDLYPKLFKMAVHDLTHKKLIDPSDDDLVRKDMMLQFGAFITESSGHLSEYLPYYRKRKDLIKKYCRPRYAGESRFYANNWPIWRKRADEGRMKMLRGEVPMVWKRSWEYASWIIEAREKNKKYRFYGNVANNQKGKIMIENLPHDGCVEVACDVNAKGFNPQAYGKLPPQMAGLCDSNMRVFELVATAAIERSKEAAIHALMLDPLTAAVCSPAEIREMTLKIFKAEEKYLPKYK